MLPLQPIAWDSDHAIRLLDQTLLPVEERYVILDTVEAVAEAIRALRVRGAPLIGVAAAMGVVQALRGVTDRTEADRALSAASGQLAATRPTAVNLAGALARMRRRAAATPGTAAALREALVTEASALLDEERAATEAIGAAGLDLIPVDGVACTICNAGTLAAGGIGTATAPFYTAHRTGRPFRVLVPETRPLLQGSRLTAWELGRAGIDVTVLTDSMVASRFARGDVRVVIVGADRVAANGDVANKIGTYALALAAQHHGVPFYVALPDTTFDPATPDGAAIPIEQRHPDEVRSLGGRRTAPESSEAWNPAFDVTPAGLVAGYVTPQGLIRPEAIQEYIRRLPHPEQV